MDTSTGPRVQARSGPSPGRLLIVCGLPGSGKTTLARQLAARYGAIRFSSDDWLRELGVSVWDTAMRDRVEALQGRLTQDLLGAGLTVVIEWGTWSRRERDGLRAQARRLGAAVELHYLDVPVEELWRRIRARDAEDPPISRADLEEWQRLFEAPDDAELRLFDAPAG